VPFLADHGVDEHNVLARLSAEDFESFVEIVVDFAALSRDALESEDAVASGKLWQSIFGSKFPLPGPTGGHRVPARFTTPTVASTAPKTERFA